MNAGRQPRRRPPFVRSELVDSDATLSFAPSCHPDSGNVAQYAYGALRLFCKECGARIADFWVARSHPLVHILHHGRTLCGKGLPPSSWPDDHAWVRFEERERASCTGCEIKAQLCTEAKEAKQAKEGRA